MDTSGSSNVSADACAAGTRRRPQTKASPANAPGPTEHTPRNAAARGSTARQAATGTSAASSGVATTPCQNIVSLVVTSSTTNLFTTTLEA